jgi:hypothetical protein
MGCMAKKRRLLVRHRSARAGDRLVLFQDMRGDSYAQRVRSLGLAWGWGDLALLWLGDQSLNQFSGMA